MDTARDRTPEPRGILTHVDVAGVDVVRARVPGDFGQLHTVVVIYSGEKKREEVKSWPGPGAGGACPPPALTGQDVHVTVLVLVEGFSSLLDGKLAEHPGNALEDTEPLRHGTVKKTGFPLLAGRGTCNLLPLFPGTSRIGSLNFTLRNYAKGKNALKK